MAEKPPSGKIALVTGASKGLGKAIAAALADAGARLALVARGREALAATVEEIRKRGGEAEAFPADVSAEDEVRSLAETVVERYGGLDILVNNAGINIRKPVTELSPAEWRAVIDTNLTGVYLMCHYFVPHMKGRGWGRIINLTSIMSWVALPGRTAYAASKAGLLGFTRALALELAEDGITCVGISPGPFATEMNQPLIRNPEVNAQFMARVPLKRWGKVEEVGKLAVYLCSDDAGFITGTDILIDGGWTAQ